METAEERVETTETGTAPEEPVQKTVLEENGYSEEEAEADFDAATDGEDVQIESPSSMSDTPPESDSPDQGGEIEKTGEIEVPDPELETQTQTIPPQPPLPLPDVLSGESLVEALKDTVVGKDENGDEVKLGDFAKDYPSVFGTLDAVLDKKLEPFKALLQVQAEAQRKANDEARVEASRSALEAALPGSRAILESPAFSEWFYRQSAAVQGLGFSGEVGDGKALIEMYRGATGKKSQPGGTKKADPVRRQILNAGRTTGSTSPKKRSQDDDLSEEEMDALFNDITQ